MKILCTDTSTSRLSLALAEGSTVVAVKNITAKRMMADNFVPAVDKLLEKAGWSVKDLDGFIVGIGPGSFTSLRVGLASIKGFAFAGNKPVLGISSLDVLAAAVKAEDEQICILTDARRNNVYSCVYERVGKQTVRTGEYSLSPIKNVLDELSGPVVLSGDALDVYKDEIKAFVARSKSVVRVPVPENFYPQAKYLAALGAHTLATQKKCDLSALNPMYLYPEDCQVRR